MRKVISYKLWVIGLVMFLTYNLPLITHNYCYAQAISSVELIENAKIYDGKQVLYQGEAIGEIMPRGDYAWVNLFDGLSAIGIWMHREQGKEVLYLGSYKSKGDIIEVTGIFHRACPEHGGDLDIHAQAIGKVSPGRMVSEKLNTAKRNLSLILLGILCLIIILRRLKPR